MVTLWALLRLIEVFVGLFTKHGFLGVPFIGETILCLELLTWWFFAYLYGMVWIGGEDGKAKKWTLVHYAYVALTLIWYYIFVMFHIIKSAAAEETIYII